jgi:hypothetical protein
MFEADRKLNKFAINTVISGLEGLFIESVLSSSSQKIRSSFSILKSLEQVSTSLQQVQTMKQSIS